jgi:Spore coat protein CotO
MIKALALCSEKWADTLLALTLLPVPAYTWLVEFCPKKKRGMRMDKQKNAKPLLYIIQPEFTDGSLRMQERFLWRRRFAEKEEARTNPTPVNTEDKDQRGPILKDTLSGEVAPTAAREESQIIEVKQELILQNDAPAKEQESITEPISQIESGKKTQNLVEKFLKQLEETSAKPSTSKGNHSEPLEKTPIEAELQKEIWQTVNSLARYPHFLEKPRVKAIVAGEPLTFQIYSKRGSEVFIKINGQNRIINLGDITEIKILD